MQETIDKIIAFCSQWLTVYFSIYGVIIGVGLIIFITILVLEHKDEHKKVKQK